MNKYQTIYLGVLNLENYINLNNIKPTIDTKTVLFSNIDFFDYDPKLFDHLQSDHIVLIPSKDNIKSSKKHKRSKEYSLFIDYLLKCPTEIKFLLNNDGLLFVSNNDLDWHNGYVGKLGYAVCCHENENKIIFYGHSASLPIRQPKLILARFDGRFLKTADSNN